MPDRTTFADAPISVPLLYALVIGCADVIDNVRVAAVIPLAVEYLECKTVFPCVRDAVAVLVRLLLIALGVKVVIQVDGNVLRQRFDGRVNGG